MIQQPGLRRSTRLTITFTVALVLACGDLLAAEYWFADDGDTLWHGGRRIHLLGIDAPELSQTCLNAAGNRWPCGRYARDHVRRLIVSGEVSCTIERQDRYHNELGVCYVGGIDLGRDLVQHGFAVVSGTDPRYLAEENEARITKRGMWAGQFTDPDTYRHSGR